MRSKSSLTQDSKNFVIRAAFDFHPRVQPASTLVQGGDNSILFLIRNVPVSLASFVVGPVSPFVLVPCNVFEEHATGRRLPLASSCSSVPSKGVGTGINSDPPVPAENRKLEYHLLLEALFQLLERLFHFGGAVDFPLEFVMMYQLVLAHFGKMSPLAGTSTRQQITLPLVFLGLLLGLCEAHNLQGNLQGGGHARVVMYVHAVPLCKPEKSLKVGGSGNVLQPPRFNGSHLFGVPVSTPRCEYLATKFNASDKHSALFGLQREFVVCQSFKQLP